MNKKQYFEAPQAELIVVRIEENMMASEFEVKQLEEGNSSWWDDEDE